jgi:hypothetical protein
MELCLVVMWKLVVVVSFVAPTYERTSKAMTGPATTTTASRTLLFLLLASVFELEEERNQQGDHHNARCQMPDAKAAMPEGNDRISVTRKDGVLHKG